MKIHGVKYFLAEIPISGPDGFTRPRVYAFRKAEGSHEAPKRLQTESGCDRIKAEPGSFRGYRV